MLLAVTAGAVVRTTDHRVAAPRLGQAEQLLRGHRARLSPAFVFPRARRIIPRPRRVEILRRIRANFRPCFRLVRDAPQTAFQPRLQATQLVHRDGGSLSLSFFLRMLREFPRSLLSSRVRVLTTLNVPPLDGPVVIVVVVRSFLKRLGGGQVSGASVRLVRHSKTEGPRVFWRHGDHGHAVQYLHVLVLGIGGQQLREFRVGWPAQPSTRLPKYAIDRSLRALIRIVHRD